MSNKLVLVLHTTHQTMQVEKVLKKNKIRHSIVPKPVKINPGCGIAISFFEEDKETIKVLCKTYSVEFEGIYLVKGDDLERFD